MTEQNRTNTSKTANEIYNALELCVSIESQAMYEAAVALATTPEAKKACAGQYKGRWSYLLDAWLADKVSTEEVWNAITAKCVPDELLNACIQHIRTVH